MINECSIKSKVSASIISMFYHPQKERNPTNLQKPKALKPEPSRNTPYYNT
jgi:hypothetical protein